MYCLQEQRQKHARVRLAVAGTISAVLLLCVVALSIALARSSTRPAPSPTPIQPTLIVSVHTALEDQEAPKLDLADLERFFAKALAARGVKIALPSQTVQLDAPAANTFLLAVSVDAIQESIRAKHLPGRAYEDDPVLYVQFSLTLKAYASGEVRAPLTERKEFHFSRSELSQIQSKREAIYDVADDLANTFVAEWADGRFGETLPASQAPALIERAPVYLVVLAFVVLLSLFVLLIILVLEVLRCLAESLHSLFRKPAPHATPPPPAEQPKPAPKSKPDYATWDRELKEALTLALKTEEFSDSACQTTAAEARPAVLEIHSSIAAKEAERLLTSKQRERHFEELAEYAATRSDLEKTRILETLQKADIWEYRVLQEAKKQALQEGSK